jgi:sulfur relay (sulfurtransferase) DsrF/TusC family protein
LLFDFVSQKPVSAGSFAMSKQQMIEAIRERNKSVTMEFLDGFDEPSLLAYYRRLTEVQGKRGRLSVWVRQGDTTAIVTRLHHLISRKRRPLAA